MSNKPTYEELEHRVKELEQTEKALKESEEKYRNIFTNSQVGLFRTDPASGHVLDINDALARMVGFKSREEILDNNLSVSDFYADGNRRQEIAEKLIKTGYYKNEEALFLNHLKEYRWLRMSGILTDEGIIEGVAEDITERKKAEEKIKASLKEKQVLLDEVNHRVKNNMAVINSLLKLQSNSIEDNQIKDVLKESQNRIYAMSAIHETLHGSENLSEIDLKSYLSKIISSIFQTYSISPDKVTLNTDIEKIPISMNQASPLGLIINELISNSLKYAFPDDLKGEINLSIKKLDKELELVIADNGIGVPDELDWKNSNTLGLKLVRTLVENQLDGSIDMESKNGTKFSIKFDIET